MASFYDAEFSRIIQRKMDGRYVSVDLGSAEQEAAVVLLEVHPENCLQKLKKTHKDSLRAADLIGRVETEDLRLRHKTWAHQFGTNVSNYTSLNL
jgi:hypothetical protein